MLHSLIHSEALLFRLLRFILYCAGLAWAALYIILPLDWHQQTILGLLMIVAGVIIGRRSNAPWITMTLMVLSMFATIRYAWWRIGATISFLRDPSNAWDWLDAAFILILLTAETYAFIILFLGFMQTIWPLKRPPVPLPRDEEEWPHVDLLIPTYNEPLSVVRYTAMAAMNVDWPADKLHIYILDDGRREAFRDFALDAGVGYRTRDDNAHAKAGNINRALQKLDSPYVAIFDCDHLPTRSFLQVTMGWFLRESKLAMVQTPHHFYSADPFERNLKQFRKIPNEGELFYGVVQDGNDFWNATFFCGSCAVLRRTALDEIGGIAVETVTEDAHTSLRMQMNGWNTAYINIPQAAGLATERLSGHIQQRVRWARGMIQILRTDNPLFAKGLRFAQRICYFNAMTHFLYAMPRLIFLTAPLVYLFFSRSNVPGYWAAILAYALPHLVLSNITNSRIQGQHRHSFWNEIYETVLSPYILLPTLVALINPKLGTFNVTAKGGFVEETYFDSRIAIPFVVLLLLNVSGRLIAIPHLVHVPGLERIWDGSHPGTICMNTIWCLFNIIILGVAITVAREEVQRRGQVRIDFVMPARVRFADGTILSGNSIDVSIGGIALTLSADRSFALGEWVTLLLPLRIGDAELPCTIVGREGEMLRLQFEDLALLEQEMLTTILYSRANAWLAWGEKREHDRPLRSLYRICKLSIRGLWATVATTFSTLRATEKPAQKPVSPITSRIAPLILLCLALATQAQSKASNTFQTAITLKDFGVLEPIDLHGSDSFRSISFSLPLDQIVDHATLHLIYRFSPQTVASTRINLMLNGSLFATLQPSKGRTQAFVDQTFAVPAELLVRNNQLTFEFLGSNDSRCDDASAADTFWIRINPTSSLDISGQRLPLVADLHQLPLPLLDSEVTRQRIIPVILAASPSTKAIQAAGIIASYFGMAADYPVPRFPVSIGVLTHLPQGNILIVTESSTDLLASFHLAPLNGPTVALRTNPNDPLGTVLIVTGLDGDQLLQTARALALQSTDLQGRSATILASDLPNPRLPDDAPRWARSEQKVALWSATDTERSSDGATPLELFLRVPPDLYYADRNHLNLHVEYRYKSTDDVPNSNLLVRLNGLQAGSIFLHHNRNLASPTVVDMPLPVVNLRPFSNSLTAQWLIQQADHSHCSATSPVNFQGSILQSSYLDLRGLPHWASLPNLELFSNAGFPFTRFADLSQTTVILPDQPSPQEIEVFLTMLAHFGAQTGYPATRVSIGTAADMHPGTDSDLLLIGTAQDNPGISAARDSMPVSINGQQLFPHEPGSFSAQVQQEWEKLRKSFGKSSPTFELQQLPDAIIEGLESPFTANRTLIFIELKDASSAEDFLSSFLNASHSSDISGDVSVLEGTAFHSFRVGDTGYTLGNRPWITRLKVIMMEKPWLLIVGLVLFSLLCGARIKTLLVRKSAIRLHLLESV